MTIASSTQALDALEDSLFKFTEKHAELPENDISMEMITGAATSLALIRISRVLIQIERQLAIMVEK